MQIWKTFGKRRFPFPFLTELNFCYFLRFKIPSAKISQPYIDGLIFLRLVGLLVAGIGMLYFVSGRMNAEGLVFATLLDRPLVPPIMAGLWHSGKVSGLLALVFAAQELGSFLWTLGTWRGDIRRE